MKRLVGLVLLLFVYPLLAVVPTTAQLPPPQNVYPLNFTVPPGGDPGGRLFVGVTQPGVAAFPSTSAARAVRAYFNIVPQAAGWAYEFKVGSERPPSRFGIMPNTCTDFDGSQLDPVSCMTIYWRDVTPAGGPVTLAPGSDPNVLVPAFTAQPGDRFAVEWNPPVQQGSAGNFIYYKNGAQVFARGFAVPSTRYNPAVTYTIVAYFAPSDFTQLAADTREGQITGQD